MSKTQFNKGHIPWNKNKKGLQQHSESTKEKMREIRKKFPPFKDKKHTLESRQKMRGRIPWNKGTSKKVKKGTGRGRNWKGEKNPHWNGGVSMEVYSLDWTEMLRISIRERDNHICQECGVHQDELDGWNKKLDVHHIDYDKKNCNPDNLIALCRNCHLKTNRNREYWIIYFKS